MRCTTTAYEQFSNFREPLREGARCRQASFGRSPRERAPKAFVTSDLPPKGVTVQAAQLHYPPLNYFLLSSLCKEPYELSPQGGTIIRLLPHQPPSNNSFARAIEAAHGVRSLLSKDKIVTNDTEKKKKGPVYKLAWGSLFAKGLRTMEKKVLLRACS